MRTIEGHKVNPANDTLEIKVLDEPGAGGANHLYQVSGFSSDTNPSCPFQNSKPCNACIFLFQNGPINEVGVNGITQEVLLEIVADRLESFQNGPFANAFNAKALEHVRKAQEALLARTRERMQRGVEGTHQA